MNLNMSIYFNLNQQINCEMICKKIENLVQKYIKSNNTLENAILSIEIREVSQIQNILPALEYKENIERCI